MYVYVWLALSYHRVGYVTKEPMSSLHLCRGKQLETHVFRVQTSEVPSRICLAKPSHIFYHHTRKDQELTERSCENLPSDSETRRTVPPWCVTAGRSRGLEHTVHDPRPTPASLAPRRTRRCLPYLPPSDPIRLEPTWRTHPPTKKLRKSVGDGRWRGSHHVPKPGATVR
jgi:hypothetical protein